MFCLDRAGLVGGDGAVHHGFLDVTYLRGFPQMLLMAPCDEVELREAMRLGLKLNQPCAIRYPRDNVPAPIPDCPPFESGRSRRVRDGDDATILRYGATPTPGLAAAEMLAQSGIETTVVNARFARPVDRDMVESALTAGVPVLTAEDHCVAGGFGSAVLETAPAMGLDASRVVRLGIPSDRFVSHVARARQLAECGIDTTGIASTVQSLLEVPVRRAQQREVSHARRTRSSARA
jgi:1-deoxy-D-xylulose-5-phosphate synthase